MRLASRMLWAFSLTLVTTGAFGADFTRDEVQSMLAAAPAATRPSFAGRSLAGLDLHDLDFSAVDLSGADLSDADLRHTKLVGAKLVGAKLPRARLNLAWIMRADFSHADLSDAVLETLVVSAGMETLPEEAAKFVGANLSGAKVTARFQLGRYARCKPFSFAGIRRHAQSIYGLDPDRFRSRQPGRREFPRCGTGARQF